MKTTTALLVIGLLAGGCATSPRLVKTPGTPSPLTALSVSPYESLKEGLNALIPDTLFPPSNIALKVVSLTRNETLYELNPDLVFAPASNQKLFTSAASLAILKPRFEFTTRVFMDTTSAARIIIKGSGDPVMTSREIDSLAQVVAGLLPPGKEWTIAGDMSYFDDEYFGYGWNWDDEPYSYSMFISPLSVDGNCIQVQVRPGRNHGDPAQVTLKPPTSYVTLEADARTVVQIDSAQELQRLTITRKWRERLNTITVSGHIRQRDTLVSRWLSVWQPERYFLTLFGESLTSCGVAVRGVALDTVPVTAVPVIAHSRTLDSVATYLNKVSDNLSGENLIKTLGAEVFGPPGTARNGASSMYAFLAMAGVDTNKIAIVDGSGLSRHNLTSVNVISRLLHHMWRRPDVFAPFFHSLPVAGVDGTLSNRMKGTPAEGNLRAKTGTLSGVSSLSGYVMTPENELLAFSMMMQNFPTSARTYRQVQDRIAVFLSQWRRSAM